MSRPKGRRFLAGLVGGLLVFSSLAPAVAQERREVGFLEFMILLLREIEDDAADDAELADFERQTLLDLDVEEGPKAAEDEEGDAFSPLGLTIDIEDPLLPLFWDVTSVEWVSIDASAVDQALLRDRAREFAEALALDLTGVPLGVLEEEMSPGKVLILRFGFRDPITDLPSIYEPDASPPGRCSVTVHARLPGRPLNIPAGLTGDDDPARDMSTQWSANLFGDGSFSTSKMEMGDFENPFPAHGTVAAVSGSDLFMMIPSSELADAEELRFGASCIPGGEGSQFNRWLVDRIDADVTPEDLMPAVSVFMQPDVVEETTTTTTTEALEETTTTTTEAAVTSEGPATTVAAQTPADPSDSGGSSPLPLILIVLGLGAAAFGGWVLWRRQSQEE